MPAGPCGIAATAWESYGVVAVDPEAGSSTLVTSINIADVAEGEASFLTLDRHSVWASESEGLLFPTDSPAPLVVYTRSGELAAADADSGATELAVPVSAATLAQANQMQIDAQPISAGVYVLLTRDQTSATAALHIVDLRHGTSQRIELEGVSLLACRRQTATAA